MGTATPGEVGLEAVVARLIERLDELERENKVKVADLEAEVAALRSAQAVAATPTDASGRAQQQGAQRTSRRKLLQLGGAAAAATVGAGVLLNEQNGTAAAAPQHFASAPYEGDATGSGNWGLKGAGTSGAQGVIGTSDSSIAVQGRSTSSMGVEGLSTSYIGVYGQSTSDVGVSGSGGTYGGSFGGAVAPLLLQLNFSASGPPTTGAHQPGEVYLDSNAVMWICVGSGSPGSWKQVVGVPSSSTVTLQQSASGPSNTAIQGDGTIDANGVVGTSQGATGVMGSSSNFLGVWGQSGNNVGVYGTSASGGYGVWGSASSGGIGGLFAGGSAPIYLVPSVAAGAPNAGLHHAGEIFVDSGATFWVCMASGTPGSWERLTSVANGPIGGAITFASNASFVPTPIRLLDTRVGASAATTPGAPIQAGAAHTFHLPVAGVSYNPGTGLVTIPANAKGLVGNCTVVNPVGVGDLAVYPDGQSLPNTAVLHYLSGQIVSNGITIGLGTNGHLAITALSAATDVIIDCQGFLV